MSDEEPGDWRNIRVRTTLGVIGSVVVAVAVISWQIFGIRAQIDDNSVAVDGLAAGMGEIREATEAAARVATAQEATVVRLAGLEATVDGIAARLEEKADGDFVTYGDLDDLWQALDDLWPAIDDGFWQIDDLRARLDGLEGDTAGERLAEWIRSNSERVAELEELVAAAPGHEPEHRAIAAQLVELRTDLTVLWEALATRKWASDILGVIAE